jgi:predicted CXXCH cytochrome family protein
VDILKKFLVLTLSLLLVLALALTANAGIRNTVHDFQSGVANGQSGFIFATSARGMCSYCHIPHSSKGDRLWPTTGDTASLARTGVVGILCASCHNLTEGNPNNTNSPGSGASLGVERKADIYNTGTINHVLVDDGVYANNTNQNYFGATTTAQFFQLNAWPYCGTQGAPGTAVNIECSSCHNPHSEAYGQSTVTTEADSYLGYGNDYLRASFYNTSKGIAFCEYCHEEKTRGGDAGNTISTGTHPVGTTANAGNSDGSQADIHIESAERTTLSNASYKIVSSVLYDMGIGTGIGAIDSPVTDNGIGTHLTSYTTGGVTCQTCHKVHGAQRGAYNAWSRGGSTVGNYVTGTARSYVAASDDGNCNILAVENDANVGTVGYAYPTEGRTTGDYNDLCIDCHETTPSVGPNWLASGDTATNTLPDGGTSPGLVTDAHPVNIAPDGVSESGFDLTVKDPGWGGTTGWTNARWAGANGTTGSHALNVNGRWTGTAAPTNGRSEIICLTCHAIHDGEKGSPILRGNSTTYCIDCHSPSIGAVSHPVGYGSRMIDNPDAAVWPNGDNLPLSDYYQGSGGASFKHNGTDTSIDMECFTCHAAHDGVDSFMLRVSDDNSRICVGCHTDFVADSHENPSNLISEYEELVSARLGSHYTGTVTSPDSKIGEIRWTFSGAWTDTTSSRDQTSHWNGGNGGGTQGTGPGRSSLRMQCQSCHTPHDAATGLVESNAYDGSITPIDHNSPDDAEDININYDGTTTTRMAYTPTTALLLGNNGDSKICATCHWPIGTHVTTIYTVPAKPDAVRVAGGAMKKYRNYCTRTSAFIVSILNGEQEYQYNVYDLIAGGEVTDTNFVADGRTPESPTNFPPMLPGKVPTTAGQGRMVCDSCHAPHAAATGSGAFILEAGTGDATSVSLANQRVAKRNYQDLCWKCHDK